MSLAQTPTLESLVQFWSEIAKQTITWYRFWNIAFEGDFSKGEIAWFKGGFLNVSFNCLDRHLQEKANKPAIIWESDDEKESRTFTFSQLHAEVCRMANVLKSLDVKKGDVVAIYLPSIPEAAIAMLACARIGAVHTVVFAGFSAQSLRQRLIDSDCKILITADSFTRGGKMVHLKEQADEACKDLDLKKLVIHNDKNSKSELKENDHWWHIIKNTVTTLCEAVPMDAEDPLFILYTSGSTGKPKGLIHTTGGYLVQVAYTHQLIFNCKKDDIFWCTADIGWITGHSYVVYGALCNGITTFMDAGIPTWPDPGRNWRIIDKHKISVFYTAPTAIRALMRAGDECLESSSRKSLKILGTVGEPINPEAWRWYFEKVGQSRCPILDTWWQTETGSILLSPQVTDPTLKPGSAGHPIPGIVPVILDKQNHEIDHAASGSLAFKFPWPSIARSIVGDHERYCKTYFSNGYYITGDGAKRDEEGDFWITGRLDDVLNVSGHRLGTAEIESALVAHPKVAEAAVVGIPHDVKGQGIYAFVILKQGNSEDSNIESILIDQVKNELGAIAKPDIVQCVDDLPKTRSGKIMRRILRKIACKEVKNQDELGDLSTLANPQVVEKLMAVNRH